MAFSRADVPDSKRGYPDFDLRDYATRRGLELLDHGTPAGFRAALPGDEELQSNVLRGTLPGGAHGVLANEGLQIGWTGDDPDWGGTFYDSPGFEFAAASRSASAPGSGPDIALGQRPWSPLDSVLVGAILAGLAVFLTVLLLTLPVRLLS
jgi:hypothetical protein